MIAPAGVWPNFPLSAGSHVLLLRAGTTMLSREVLRLKLLLSEFSGDRYLS